GRATPLTTRLVLLSGMDGTGLLFEPFVEALPSTLVPLVVSYPPRESLGYEDLLDLAVHALPSEGPFVLLGESFFGFLALMVVASRPPGLIAVVLCASFVRSPIPWFPRALAAIVRRSLFGLVPSFVETALLLGRDATPELRAR